MPRTPFGDLLAHYRTRARLPQTKLSEAAGCDHSYVSRLESGAREPSRGFIATLARALDLDPAERDRLYLSAGYATDTDLVEPIRRPRLRSRPVPGITRTEGQLLDSLWRDHRDPVDGADDPGPTDLRPQRPAEKVPERRARRAPRRLADPPLTDEELDRLAERILAGGAPSAWEHRA